MKTVAEVLAEIGIERWRQMQKFGEQNHPNGTGGPGFKAFESLAKSQYSRAAKTGTITWAKILEEEFWEAMACEDDESLKSELIQVAAVCSAWIECLGKRDA